jgi:ABC-2 type transport system ATP-binding protein
MHWQGDLDALKESVVRIHLRSSSPLPQTLTVPGSLSMRIDSNYATAVVSNWSDAMRPKLKEGAAIELEVELLSLEEIFLELHR